MVIKLIITFLLRNYFSHPAILPARDNNVMNNGSNRVFPTIKEPTYILRHLHSCLVMYVKTSKILFQRVVEEDQHRHNDEEHRDEADPVQRSIPEVIKCEKRVY